MKQVQWVFFVYESATPMLWRIMECCNYEAYIPLASIVFVLKLIVVICVRLRGVSLLVSGR